MPLEQEDPGDLLTEEIFAPSIEALDTMRREVNWPEHPQSLTPHCLAVEEGADEEVLETVGRLRERLSAFFLPSHVVQRDADIMLYFGGSETTFVVPPGDDVHEGSIGVYLLFSWAYGDRMRDRLLIVRKLTPANLQPRAPFLKGISRSAPWILDKCHVAYSDFLIENVETLFQKRKEMEEAVSRYVSESQKDIHVLVKDVTDSLYKTIGGVVATGLLVVFKESPAVATEAAQRNFSLLAAVILCGLVLYILLAAYHLSVIQGTEEVKYGITLRRVRDESLPEDRVEQLEQQLAPAHVRLQRHVRGALAVYIAMVGAIVLLLMFGHHAGFSLLASGALNALCPSEWLGRPRGRTAVRHPQVGGLGCGDTCGQCGYCLTVWRCLKFSRGYEASNRSSRSERFNHEVRVTTVNFTVRPYDEEHLRQLLAGPRGQAIQNLINSGLKTNEASILLHAMFAEQDSGEEAYRSLRELAKQVPDSVPGFRKHIVVQNQNLLMPVKRNNNGQKWQVERVGVACATLAMNEILGTTEADWECIKVGHEKSLDFKCTATDGTSIIALEAKGTVADNPNNPSSGSGSKMKSSIEAKKKVAREREVQEYDELYGVITSISQDPLLQSSIYLLDPPADGAVEDPRTRRIITRMKYYLRYISLVSEFRMLLSLYDRINLLEAGVGPDELDAVPLKKISGEPFSLPESFGNRPIFKAGEFVGRVYRHPRGVRVSERPPRLFVGFHSDLFNILVAQRFDRLLAWRWAELT